MTRRFLLILCLLAPALAGASGISGAGEEPQRDAPAAILAQAGAAPVEAPPAGQPAGHEHDEGLALRPAVEETVAEDATTCDDGAAVRPFDIVALRVDITLNRYGDHDREGYAYVMADRVDDVRAAERQGVESVSLGLQGDVIQPLVLRVRPGECARFSLRNDLFEPASFHLHSSALVLADSGAPATAAEPLAMAAPSSTVVYEWAIPADEPEGSRVFHSHGDPRRQSGHGLFGTLVVEPPDSTWTDPRTGAEDTTQWDAVVHTPDGTFREFVYAYHEIGHEDHRVDAAGGGKVPQVDPLTQAYRPAARAINYRSEPFMNRLQAQLDATGVFDEALAYSSYAFGDPATPIARSYVGDPVKERVVHAGAEVFHVHHVHGGSVRWRRQPGAGDTGFGTGLDKHPDHEPGPSERTDSQTLGPSEAFDVDHECSAGGCQQGAGDYLVHCHVAHHYFAGMWGIWRVYDTLQDGPSSTDALAPLPPLADGADDVRAAVTSDELEAPQLARARAGLPPPGVGRPGDASVWNWTEVDGRFLGEPDDPRSWPGHEPASTDASRPPILFDPDTGRPAHPLLRPHLGARPPFAPGHGPAPHLDTPRADGSPSPPGADGPASLCPAGTTLRSLSLRAIELPVPLNERERIVDPAGTLFVLAEDEAAVRANPRQRVPLAIRANAGEDCIDVLLTNRIPDNANHPFSKVSAHIHFVQFDVQGGDGVDTGFSFEQTVRPFEADPTRLEADAPSGAISLTLDRAPPFHPGSLVAVGIDTVDRVELRRVVAATSSAVTFDRPLEHDHARGELVSTEFVRYRWYADAQVGTSYFHDHVNGLRTWQHGLVGALVVEPPGSTYHDPRTGAEIESGALADVHVPADRRVSADVDGSFRELVSFIQDGSRVSNVGRSPGSKLNLRAEPLAERAGPPSRAFSSTYHGDPETPIVEAYVGDPVVVRATVSGTNEVHTWHVDGHWFRREPWSRDAAPATTAHLGISERMDLVIPAAGGPQARAGDYLYQDGRALKLQEGAWGLLRVIDRATDLQPLPGMPAPEDAPAPPPVCPADAPVRRVDVAAVDARLPMLAPKRGRAFVLARDVDAVIAGEAPTSPLVLRATVGDCLVVNLANRLPAGAEPVSLHVDGLAYDPLDSGGVEAGHNPPQVVNVGDERVFTYYAHPEYGPIAGMIRDGGDLGGSGAAGLYGAIIVSPAGSDVDETAGWDASVTGPDGDAWRDVVLFMHDDDDAIGTHRMPYTVGVRGAAALSYRRGEGGVVVETFAGDPLRVHVLAPWSEQAQVFSIEGHRWPLEPRMKGSTRVDSIAIGGLEAITLEVVGGAGGELALPGTYWLGDHREPYRDAGLWGTLVVHGRCDDAVDLEPLPGRGCDRGTSIPVRPIGGSLLAVAALVGGVTVVRRRSRR